MVFSSTTFLLFFLPLVLLLYFGVPHKWATMKYRNTILLLSSLFFYAWGEPVFVIIMLLSIALNWSCALRIERHKNSRYAKILLYTIISFDVLLIFIFKYLSFVLHNLGIGLGVNWNVDISLPIGISFFTFQIMSYIFDVYREKVKASKNLFDVALYISLFPQLIAGPIVQYSTIEKEITHRKETWQDFTDGLFLFIVGLGKKVLIANYMAIIADNHFESDFSDLSAASAWLGAFAYTMQIYFDFSGYSDMAIGLGRMFGFHFKKNFDHPYVAKSISDFWKRWHISLTSWFREYVYIPLGGNRISVGRTIINTGIVWLLTGIWHGANWTFILWGAYYFVLLLIERQTNLNKKEWGLVGGIVSRIITFVLVILGWVVFRSEAVSDAMDFIGAMFGSSGVFVDATFKYYIENGWTLIFASLVLSIPAKELFNRYFSKATTKNGALMAIKDVPYCVFILLIFGLSLLSVIQSTYNPFIYFNF